MVKTESVAFGGGCFWCTEAVFLELKGVMSVTPGYAGGHAVRPTYEEVSTGKTGHAEVIDVEYDPEVIPFSALLDIFFKSHDPTSLNRQGNDIGTQYRSVILYSTSGQKKEAEERIETLTRDHAYARPIVTAIEPLTAFYPAEEYHMRYYERHPDDPYANAVITPKVAHIRAVYPHLLKR